MTGCAHCGARITHDAYVCSSCAAEMFTAMIFLARLAPDLSVTLARLDKMGEGGKSSGDELYYAAKASNAARRISIVVDRWARFVLAHSSDPPCPIRCEHQHCQTLYQRVRSNPVALSAVVIARHAAWLSRRAEALIAWPELWDARRLIERTVDRPPAVWFAGKCWTEDRDGKRCQHDLYAQHAATHVTCEACGTVHDVEQRHAWLLGQARDTLAVAEDLSRFVSAMGQPLLPDRVRKWASRGRLAAHGTDYRGRPQYRVGDAIDLLARIEGERHA